MRICFEKSIRQFVDVPVVTLVPVEVFGVSGTVGTSGVVSGVSGIVLS